MLEDLLDILEYLYFICACLLWNLLEQKEKNLFNLAHNCFYNEDLNFFIDALETFADDTKC